jgi:hypothetical protein
VTTALALTPPTVQLLTERPTALPVPVIATTMKRFDVSVPRFWLVNE